MKKVLIIGGASAIARETAKCFASEGASLFLADISSARLESVKQDIQTRYQCDIHLKEFDALDFENHDNIINQATENLGGLDVVLIAHGTLGKQTEIESYFPAVEKEIRLNFLSAASLATKVAEFFDKQGRGTLAVISSVAGERGRRSNYIYGSAKGALTLYISGLRGRFAQTNVKIITLKPGLVDTPMTQHMSKSPLFASAETVGASIYKAIKSGKEIVYIPGFWRIVMAVVRLIPENIFKKMKF
jgi:short-subunit dehydrogenase